jgi:pyridoxamine 5'-phosphate oxidase
MEDKNLGHLRKTYTKGILQISDMGSNPMVFFKKWFDEAHMHPEIEEANAMQLVTLGLDDFPKARVVLLKSLSDVGLVFYTNYQSEKGRSMDHHSKVGISFFWPPLERQVIIKGEAEKVSQSDSDTYFASRPKGSQLGAIVSDQSRIITDRSIMEAKLDALTIEYQDKEIKRPEYWGGYLVRPKSIEFWQGRPNRLHDRIRCQLQGEVWTIERLAP